MAHGSGFESNPMATILEKWRTEWLRKRSDGHDPREMACEIAPQAVQMATILEKWRTKWLRKRSDGHDPREMAYEIGFRTAVG